MPNPVNIKQLRALLEVARTGSFAAAADRLSLTPSALTAAIQQLEAAVGVRMFDRTTRRVSITPHAAEFLGKAERLLQGLDSAVSDLQALAEGQRGHIRIGAASSVIGQFLIPVLATFREQYPGITISLRNPAAQETEQLVLQGEVDFAIDSRYGDYGELSYTPLLADAYGVACHCNAPIARLEHGVRWDQLTWGRYVGFNADTGIGHFLRAQVPDFPAWRAPHDEVVSAHHLFDLLGERDYFSVLPALTFQQNRNPSLRWLELREPHLTRELCVITRPLRSLAPSAQRLLGLLQSRLQASELPHGVTSVQSPSH
jgi:DNA-binding transcriptional LysR family regulator